MIKFHDSVLSVIVKLLSEETPAVWQVLYYLLDLLSPIRFVNQVHCHEDYRGYKRHENSHDLNIRAQDIYDRQYSSINQL